MGTSRGLPERRIEEGGNLSLHRTNLIKPWTCPTGMLCLRCKAPSSLHERAALGSAWPRAPLLSSRLVAFETGESKNMSGARGRQTAEAAVAEWELWRGEQHGEVREETWDFLMSVRVCACVCVCVCVCVCALGKHYRL